MRTQSFAYSLANESCTVSVELFETVPMQAAAKVSVMGALIDVAAGVAVAVPVSLHALGPPTGTQLPAGNVNVSATCDPEIAPVIVPRRLGDLPDTV